MLKNVFAAYEACRLDIMERRRAAEQESQQEIAAGTDTPPEGQPETEKE
ncbi:MAG TPA: hypothetical protein VH144_02450 [Candidatus Saccharimonadales bacterium]|jgi:hypothetical protein|nr:hypothetical protein [Candidatus Saccharimonadales bacterium]